MRYPLQDGEYLVRVEEAWMLILPFFVLEHLERVFYFLRFFVLLLEDAHDLDHLRKVNSFVGGPFVIYFVF